MLTDEDREALEPMLAAEPGLWLITPPCFEPSALCRSQESRGLLELKQITIFFVPHWTIRLSAFGRIALKGKINDDRRNTRPGAQQPSPR